MADRLNYSILVLRRRHSNWHHMLGHNHASAIEDYVPPLLHGSGGDNADRRLPVLLRVHWLRSQAQAEARGLLCILFVRIGALSADAADGRKRVLLTVECESQTVIGRRGYTQK